MSALLTLAQSLGIDSGPLNQIELQEQTCSTALDALIRAAEIMRTSTAEHSRMWKESRQMESERDELAAQVERLRGVLTRIVNEKAVNGGFYYKVHEELFYLAESALSETPPAALAALKAQWQADAVREVASDIRELTAHHIQYSVSLMACRVDGVADSIERLDRIRQRAKEHNQ